MSHLTSYKILKEYKYNILDTSTLIFEYAVETYLESKEKNISLFEIGRHIQMHFCYTPKSLEKKL